jgi:uncharacterized protein YegL
MSSDYHCGRDGQSVMPFYLICDVSASMWQEMTALHAGVMRLWEAIVQSPIINAVARICVMTFSDDARVVVGLRQMSDLPEGMPKFAYENQTHYGAAFRMLAREIPRDYAELRRHGHNVFRPCVYFLTDGEPSDHNWRQALSDMLSDAGMARMRAYPIIVPFGFRDATDSTLRRLAYPPGVGRWYHASSSTVATALEELLGIIRFSVLESGYSAVAGDPEHVLPEPGRGSGTTSGMAGDEDLPEA